MELAPVAFWTHTKRPRAAQTAGGMAQEGLAPMQDKPSGAGHERATTTADQDDRDQAAVLREVLYIYPEVLTLEELGRELTFASDAFGQRDRIERAVRDLAGVGLLHQVGPQSLRPRRPRDFSPQRPPRIGRFGRPPSTPACATASFERCGGVQLILRVAPFGCVSPGIRKRAPSHPRPRPRSGRRPCPPCFAIT
jgi:hypothetical protein